METHSLTRIERPECADGGPDIFCRFRHHHQAFAFHLSREALGARRPQPREEASNIGDTRDEYRGPISTLAGRDGCSWRRNGANWRAT
jgi:hypothetical protein